VTPRNVPLHTVSVYFWRLIEPLRELGVTLSFVNDADTLIKVNEIYQEIYEDLKDIPDMDYIYFFIPQPKVIQTHSAKRGGNSLGLEGVTNDQIGTCFPDYLRKYR